MELREVLSRHRNDFSWLGQCRHCAHIERYGDGYADAFYCQRVVPERHCPNCGLNCYGEMSAWKLNAAQSDAFAKALSEPPFPNEKLVRAAKRYQTGAWS